MVPSEGLMTEDSARTRGDTAVPIDAPVPDAESATSGGESAASRDESAVSDAETVSGAEAEKERIIDRIALSERGFLRMLAPYTASAILSSDLTIQQLKVLVLISVLGEPPMHTLAERLEVSLATATGLVDRLVARDMLTRSEDAKDRRIRRVRLSQEGEATLTRLHSSGQAGKRRILRRLSLEHLTAMASLVDALNDAISADLAEHFGDPPGEKAV
jgi:DNA-binding MarR family transcriptional regulator